MPGLFEGLARTKQAMRDRGMALRMAQRMDRIRDAVDALEGDVESGMERRAAMLEREAMGSQPRLASRQLAHKLAGKPVLRALRKTTTKKALRAVLLNTWTRTRTKTKTRSSTSKTRTRTTSASATKSKSPTATKTKTLTKTPTTTALFTPIPPAPRSTLAPAPPAPRPSVVLNSKAMPIDPALPAPTGPISTVLVSDYSFGLIWGSVATAKQVRHFGARFWDSNMVVRGFAVDCGTVSDLVSLVPDGKVTKSLATPYRAIQVELTPSEASNKLWGCSVRLISGSGIGPQSTALRIGVDLRTGDARIAALRASASAFFDFNAPLSTLQPTSFETHSSLCSDPKTTAAYITSSYLLLTASSSESPLCPPGSSHFFSVKPLGTLDFSGGRTVFISFDTDGVPEWGSQLSVSLIANPSADRDAPGFGTGLPSARQYTSYSADSGQSITLTQTAGGFLTLRQKWTNLVRVSDLEERDLGFGVPGLRRTVVLRVSKGRVRVEVSGVQLMDVAPTMDWDRAQLVFQLSGNSTDDPVGIPVHRVTIDNLHVSYSSAPPAAPIIRDFPFSLGMGSYRAVIPGQQASFAVNVGSLAGATSATLFFSFHGFPNQKEIWEWQNSLCILKPNAASGQVVNLYGYSGVRSIACGPGDAEQSWDAVKAGYGTPRNWPGGWIVKLDPSWIGEGTNYFVFDTLAPLVIGDLHVEVGFAGAAPAYSPQTHWLAPYLTSGNPEPTVAWVGTGPSAKLNYIGSKPVWQNYPLFFGPGTGLKVNGTLLKVDFDAGTWVGGMVSGAAFVTAGCNGVTKVEILVDDRVVRTFSWPNPGMPYVYGWATIDLAAIGDWSLGGRTMKVDVRAYDSRGNPSFPLYNGIAAYRPIGVWSNKSQPAIVTADLGAPGSVKGVPVFPAAVAGTQPAPKGLTVVEDDRVATFSWDNEGYGFYSDYGMRFWGKRVSGYQVSWYPLSNRSQVSKMVTPFRAIQLQPLAPGVRYGAVVQTIDSEEAGRLGPVSAEITFQSNSTRVDQLREICTGFFDDFNLPAGPFDAKKWVTSYSVCTDPLAGANFVNGQLHAHNAVKTSGKCPSSNMSNIYPAMVTSRPIGVLDFTGTVGTIGFDFDGPSATKLVLCS